MGDTFHQLGQLFVQALPTVVMVFLLFIILDRILFRPLIATMQKREELTVGALARAREEAAAVEAKTRRYEDAFQAARQEVYRQRETDRHANLAERDAGLRQAREQAEALLRSAQADLAGEVERAKAELDGACMPLAEEISPKPGGARFTARWRESLAMARKLRLAACFALLGFCLAGFSSPIVTWAQDSSEAAKKEESSEPPHELLYKIINFAILVAGLGYLLRKPAGEFFSSRSASIQKSLEEGRKALEASQAQLRIVEEKLKGLEAEIAAFKAAALSEMAAERERLKQAGAEEAARILEAARNQTTVAVRAAKLELKKYAAQKSVDLAEEIIRGRLDDQGRQRLVKQFVATIEAKEQKN